MCDNARELQTEGERRLEEAGVVVLVQAARVEEVDVVEGGVGDADDDGVGVGRGRGCGGGDECGCEGGVGAGGGEVGGDVDCFHDETVIEGWRSREGVGVK